MQSNPFEDLAPDDDTGEDIAPMVVEDKEMFDFDPESIIWEDKAALSKATLGKVVVYPNGMKGYIHGVRKVALKQEYSLRVVTHRSEDGILLPLRRSASVAPSSFHGAATPGDRETQFHSRHLSGQPPRRHATAAMVGVGGHIKPEGCVA